MQLQPEALVAPGPVARQMLPERRDVLGVRVSVTSYAEVARTVVAAAREQRPLTVSALAVHGVMTGALDASQRQRLNALDILTPDGQPVRWALNLLHGAGLRERVYGPTLMLRICEAAAREGLPVFLFGSDAATLASLRANLQVRLPGLHICGAEPSAFRQGTAEEARELAARIRASGARIVFVGLGCPRQEVFLHDMRDLARLPMLAVGAAYAFHAGTLAQAPAWMQRRGLEWLFRLVNEPHRLWKRYLVYNPLYVAMLALQALGRKPPPPAGSPPPPQWWL